MNLGLAPRSRACWVCRNVASPEDVTVRVLDDAGEPLPDRDAVDYLGGIGHSASRNTWASRLRTHRKHIVAWAARGMVTTPAERQLAGTTRLEAPDLSHPSWVRGPDRAIDLGAEAMKVIAVRLDEMKDTDLIAVARLGLAAASKRGDWEAKGRQLGQVDELLKLTFGAGKNAG